MDRKSPSPANIAIMAGGAVMLIASVLPFVTAGSESRTAWSGDVYAPVSLIPVLCGVTMAVEVALAAFSDAKLPERIFGFGWNQIHLILGAQAALMMVAFVIVDKYTADNGIGMYLMLLASIALVAGAVLRFAEPRPPDI